MVLPQFAFLDLGTPELIIVLVIILVLFGSRRLPELSRSIGQSMRELRKGINDSDEGGKNKDEKNNEDKKTPSDPKTV